MEQRNKLNPSLHPLEPPSLNACIEYATLTLKRLALQRHIEQVKEKRKRSLRRFIKMQKEYEARKLRILRRTYSLFFGQHMSKPYLSAVKSWYDILPAAKTLRLHAELIKHSRHLKLMQFYYCLRVEDNSNMLCHMEDVKNNLIVSLDFQKDEIDRIQEELVDSVIEQVGIFCEQNFVRNNQIKNKQTRNLVLELSFSKMESLESACQHSCSNQVSRKEEPFSQCSRSY